MDVKNIKLQIIKAGEKAVMQLIKDDELAADKLKNAAATKKLAIFDAFEILKRIEDENKLLNDGDVITKSNTTQGFAERRSK